MCERIVTCLAIGVALSATVVLSGQTAGTPAAGAIPRTPDGRPDLQGVWANNVVTPLERPPQFAGRPTMTDEELEMIKARAKELIDGGDAFFGDELFLALIEGKTEFSSSDTQTGNYDQTWLSDRVFDNRTSLIIDPPDGRVPPLTPEAERLQRERAAERRQRGPADWVEDLSLGTRCIHYGTPYIRPGYQSYFAITQAPDVVVLRTEMIHDARVFPIDAGPHLSPAITAYHGDSRAHWEGDTLVVDTTNFSPKANYRGSTDKLHLIEKFRRVSQDTLEYYVTFEDPTVWTKPWTAMVPLKQTGEQMFEYACHEGNYGLRAILSGARAQEREALESNAAPR